MHLWKVGFGKRRSDSSQKGHGLSHSMIMFLRSEARSGGGEGPFVKVKLMGLEMMGLLDSGKSRILISSEVWRKLKKCRLPWRKTPITEISLANRHRRGEER